MTSTPDATTATLLAFARALRARQGALLAGYGVHPGQDALLVQLWDTPGSSPSTLAARLGIEPPTVTRMVHRLERAGWVERRRDPDDGRSFKLYPTPRSRLLEVAVRRCWSELGEAVSAELGHEQTAEFIRAAQAVAARLTPPPEAP